MPEDTSGYRPSPHECPLAYPGRRPGSSYLFCGDTIDSMDTRSGVRDQAELRSKILEGVGDGKRYLIVGYGSNANPAQLRDKFGSRCRGTSARQEYGPPSAACRHPVLRGMVRGYDAVYEGRISSNGYAPATLVESPGTAVEAWANVLDRKQLDVMDCTENRPNTYMLADVGAEFVLENGAAFSPVYAYVASGGAYMDSGRNHVRVSGAGALNPKCPGMTQEGILGEFRARLGGDTPSGFASRIKTEEGRRCYNDKIVAYRKPPAWNDVGSGIAPISWDGVGIPEGGPGAERCPDWDRIR